MPPPPPPPPGPPPPPMMAVTGPPSNAGGPPRDMLLQSIRQGAKLKKAVTNDKSAPLIAGKISGGSSSTESSRGDVTGGNMGRMNGGPPQLGGLFAGGMPKLKPTGLGIVPSSSPIRELNTRPPEIRNVNRGPPPQPPPASIKPNLPNLNDSSSPSDNGHPVPRPQAPSRPPVGGYGKPNVAPKPPPLVPNMSALHGGQQDAGQLKPSPPPKKLLVNGRTPVSRAQSMRSPRSPPVAPPSFANGPLVNQKGSIHLSQDGLNMSKTGTLPHNFHQTLKMAPSPPGSGYRGTPTRPPGQRPPPPPTRPAPPTSAPPPPPPHRTSPAPPPPRLPPAAPNSAPPAPPTRNSSMRNGSASSVISELESRFSFHNSREFPVPEPFRNTVKQYNSRPPSNSPFDEEDDEDLFYVDV